jgi:hypothetical protein
MCDVFYVHGLGSSLKTLNAYRKVILCKIKVWKITKVSLKTRTTQGCKAWILIFTVQSRKRKLPSPSSALIGGHQHRALHHSWSELRAVASSL